MLLNKLKVF